MMEIIGYKKEYFDFLQGSEQNHFWYIGWRELIFDQLHRHLGDELKDIKMLEIGCGNGNVLGFLKSKGLNVVGGDFFTEGLMYCKEKFNFPVYRIAAGNLPFKNDSYDVVGLFDVIEHIKDDESVLKEVQRVLKEVQRVCKRRGRVIVTVPAYKLLWGDFDEFSYHQRRYGRKELIQKLERAGFVVRRITHYMFFLLPIIFLIRKIRNITPKKHKYMQTTSELKVLPVLNTLFLYLLRGEKFIIKYFDCHLEVL